MPHRIAWSLRDSRKLAAHGSRPDWDANPFCVRTLRISASTDDTARTPPDATLRLDQFHMLYFGNAVTVQDVIVGCVPLLLRGAAAWIDRIDFSTLEPMPTELIDKAFRSRFTDQLWRVRFRGEDGADHWLHIIVMLEFQATVDWFMALRMQSYAVRIYESLWVGRTPNSESRLPPILGIVVYSGRRPSRRHRRCRTLRARVTC